MNDAPIWAVAAVVTFAASVHCVGMCGGLSLAVGTARGSARWRILSGQVLLQTGKAATYAFLGAIAGAFGHALVRYPLFGWTGRILTLVAGIAIVLAGLSLLGLRSTKGGTQMGPLWKLWGRFVGPLLSERPRGFSLIVGMAMGFLPCPLVYAGLAVAAASASAAAGAAIMAGVALGTVPALTLVAVSGSLFPADLRTRLARVAGLLLLVVGAFALTRGLGLH
ncbi:MAG: sulfite exporter TauE/SafE family protein [Deltaproteobacteria bacterium]|nr:sulfite exporter TauE/SafE family protein [Deltaproteobacteria bacterium]